MKHDTVKLALAQVDFDHLAFYVKKMRKIDCTISRVLNRLGIADEKRISLKT